MRRFVRVATAGLGLVLTTAAGPAPQQAPSRSSAFDYLDRYGSGNFSAPTEFASIPSLDASVRAIEEDGARWIGEDAATTPRRRIAAAAFALEAARPLADSPRWSLGRRLIAWGCDQLRASASPPTETERGWFLASVALLESEDDWPLLVGRPGPPPPGNKNAVLTPIDHERLTGHLAHGRARFPGEPRFDLAAAVAAENRIWSVRSFGRQIGLSPTATDADVQSVRAQLAALTTAEPVAAEAHLRLGFIRSRMAEVELGLQDLERAERLSTDPHIVFLSRLFTGVMRERQGVFSRAIAAYRGALEVSPRAQSATTLLSALLFTSGQHAEAASLAESFLSGTTPAANPWRTYRLGDARLLPSLVTRLREGLR